MIELRYRLAGEFARPRLVASIYVDGNLYAASVPAWRTAEYIFWIAGERG